MGVDHRGLHVLVTQKVLDRADIVRQNAEGPIAARGLFVGAPEGRESPRPGLAVAPPGVWEEVSDARDEGIWVGRRHDHDAVRQNEDDGSL